MKIISNYIKTNYYRLAFLAILVVSISLRFAVAILNRDANDNHQNVIQIILTESRLPKMGEDWESFQPKLFHVAMAVGIRIFHLTDSDQQIVFMQLANSTAGLIVLFAVYRFLQTQPISAATRFWTFCLVAWSPAMIAIDAQATNDAFVILFGSLAIYFAVEYFRTGQKRQFILMAAMTILAGLSKGNGLVVFVALAIVFFLRFGMDLFKKSAGGQRLPAIFLISWMLVFIAIVPVGGQYVERYTEAGSPFAINMTPDPLPSLSAESISNRPGVVSFVKSYLSFPFFDLLQTPFITGEGKKNYPVNRISFWAQMYGRIHFLHYSEEPISWQTENPLIMSIGRGILLLALLPTAMGILGFASQCVHGLRRLLMDKQWEPEACIHVLTVAGYLLFAMLYSWEYRDFSTMKTIFLFPATISMVYFVARGMEFMFKIVPRKINLIMKLSLGALLVLYGADVFYLIVQLYRIRFFHA